MSFGSSFDVNNVVLDLNGFKLQGSAAGSATQAVGIGSIEHRKITVRNGTVRGFAFGVVLQGGGANIVEDLRVDFSTVQAINLDGAGNIVRNNVVVSTGNSTLTLDGAPTGINVGGSLARVLNNEVLDMLPTGTGFGKSARETRDGIVHERKAVVQHERTRGRLLYIALSFLGLDVASNAMPSGRRALHAWLDSWHGIGLIERGLAREDLDPSLTRYGPFWGAAVYWTGSVHPTAQGTGWQPAPHGGVGRSTERGVWAAVQQAVLGRCTMRCDELRLAACAVTPCNGAPPDRLA